MNLVEVEVGPLEVGMQVDSMYGNVPPLRDCFSSRNPTLSSLVNRCVIELSSVI